MIRPVPRHLNIVNIKPETTNVGNEIIQQGLYAMLREVFQENVNIVTLPACNKGNPGKHVGLTAASIYEINRLADGVIVGGGNLLENGGLTVDSGALAALEVPMMLFSIAWGRIFNRRGELVRRSDALPDATIRALCQASTATLVRDQATADHLATLGIAAPEVVGCPGFFLQRTSPHLPPPMHDVSQTVLLSVRHPERMSLPPDQQQRVYGDILRMRDTLAGQGFDDVRILCHDYRDIFFAAAFSDIPYIYTESAPQLLSLLRHCRFNLGYRLHAFIPCVAFRTPSILISYDERAQSVLDTTGLGEWGIDMLRSPDLVPPLLERLARLDRFTPSVAAGADILDTLGGRMMGGLNRFADLVRDRAALR